MGRGYFRGFTAAEKTELWDRWQRGESLKAIGRAFGKPSSSIYFQLAHSRGNSAHVLGGVSTSSGRSLTPDARAAACPGPKSSRSFDLHRI
jgi:hypothetical protein